MNSVSVILVDDEKEVRGLLKHMIQQLDFVLVAGEASSISEAVKLIHRTKPNLVFLDIEMPGYTGLQLLDFFNEEEIEFDIVFVTAYNEYAIQAFKLSAFDYLLKPVDEEQLLDTLQRYQSKKNRSNLIQQIELLKNIYESDNQGARIAVPSTYGVEFIEIDYIAYLEAKNNYTEVYLNNKERIVASKPISDFESILNHTNIFFRTHRSFLVNLKEVARLNTKDGMFVELKNNESIPLSRYRRKEFDQLLGQFKV